MKINAVLQKYPKLERPEAVFEISNILNHELAVEVLGHALLRVKRATCNHLKETKTKPPFSITWYEGYIDKGKQVEFGFYLLENNNFLNCILFHFSIRGAEIVASQEIEMNEKYMIPDNGFSTIRFNEKVVKSDCPDTFSAIQNIFYSVHVTNALLNCKNVSTDAHDFPNRRSISHYKKTGKPYFEKYYTLKVKLPGKKHTAGNGENGGWSNAFHIYRGHFKTYTEAAPLFGKFTGTYWWESGIRGNLDTGIIDKDYELEAGE